MSPSAPENEDRMQALVARYPELITDGDGDLLLIQREQSVADSEVGTSRWSVDHLFVTGEGVPVLVELKRAVDSRLRREVVGQLLDYAANATAYWQAGRIADSFAATATAAAADPDAVLAAFIGDRDPEAFWGQVDANFKAGRIKLVFVADEISRDLARVVEFLNDQMRADVRAVELRWFAGEGGVISLSPRVIGETERAAAAKAATPPHEPLPLDDWIAKHLGPMGSDAVDGARAFVGLVERLGGTPRFARAQGSIIAAFDGENDKSFSPLHLWTNGTVSFSLGYLLERRGLREESVRQDLLDRLAAIVGPTNSRKLTGFPAFRVEKLADRKIAAGVERWLADALPLMAQ
jgi:hypothetical protein